ncbi:hypothetical protein SLEP1_g33039 [Rubroshorea leprosula]|uniref:Uncharacterized protein n=1 Tax=Rubroshorea leprosula TaxID=152421 RepID=A0AAV5KFC2_9ROSI|nr:hypothetical protein SLEP1_g33039 [Rubroshorea leprosula]
MEPIAMIVPPVLQHLPGTITPESSASLSAGGDSGNHHSSTSRDSSTKETPSEVGDAEEGGLSPPAANTETNTVVGDTCEGDSFQAALLVSQRMKNELAAHISEWRTPNMYMNYPKLALGDVDLKNRLLDYVKAEGLVDLEALVTQSSSHYLGEMSSILERQRQRVQSSRNRGARRARDDCNAKDDVPLIRRRTSTKGQAVQPVAACTLNVPPALARDVTELVAASTSGMQNFVPPVDRQHTKGHVLQYGGHAAMLKLMDSSEMVNRAGSAENQANELARKDVVAVASTNTTTDIYNEIRGKVLRHRADFPICELAFFEGEEMDEQGKSLAPLADATMRLKWELNEEGVPVWPSSIVKEGKDTEGLPMCE